MAEPHGRPRAVPSLPSEASVEELRAQLAEIRRCLDDAERGIAGVRAPVADVATTAELIGTERAGTERAGTGQAGSEQGAPTSAGHGDRSAGAAHPKRRRRATLVAVLAGVVLVALAVIVVPTVLTMRPGPEGTTAAGSAPPTVVSQAPGYRPGVTAAGTDVTVSLGAGQDLSVQEQATSSAPRTTVELRQPDPASAPASRLAAPTVTDVIATSQGRPLTVTRSADGWTVRDPDGREIRRVRLTYTLRGAVIARGAPGRALFVVTPLTALASRAEGAPVQVRVADARVRQAACLGAPPADQLCGTLQADGWLARIPAAATVPFVVFQIDAAGPS